MLSKYGEHGFLLLTFLMAVSILNFSGCSNEQASSGGFKMPPTPVEAANVRTQDIANKFEAVGTIEAIEGVTIVSEIDASVVSLPFNEGSFIKKGDLIAQLDDSQLSAEVNRTQALYTQSQSAYSRVKSIVDQNAGTKQDLDDALANLKVAEANYELAKARLSKTRVTAPFDGFVGARKISVGTFLRTGQEITELANLNEIRVGFSAPERYLALLKRGAKVVVTSTIFPGNELSGEIIAIEPILNSETRNINVVAKVKNTGQKFRPGMSANIAAVLDEHLNALTVPNEAVFANGNQSFVYIIKNDSTVAATPVTLGMQTPKVVEITSGLKSGMMVVRTGHQKLFDGAKVMPVNSDTTSSNP